MMPVVALLAEVSARKLKDISLMLCEGVVECENPCVLSVDVVGSIREFCKISVSFFILFYASL